MSRLLLLSNSTIYREPYLEWAREHLRNFLGNEVKSVLFIPYAGITMSYDQYTASVRKVFEELGYGITGIHETENAVETVQQAEAIAVGGGNTFELLDQVYQQGILSAIQDRVAEGMPYMGWSAGSNLASPTIKTTNDMPVTEPPSFNALNLVPFQINPHFTNATLPNHGGESRGQRLQEFLVRNPEKIVLGIPEGSLLKREGSQLSFEGIGPMKVFRLGSDPENFQAGDYLDHLLLP